MRAVSAKVGKTCRILMRGWLFHLGHLRGRPPAAKGPNMGSVIATLTMNPALDISAATDRVMATDKLRCSDPRYDPGGGGINVARVVEVLGGSATTIFPAGGPAGEMLKELLQSSGVRQCTLPIAGKTRESFTIDERSTGQQFRFVLPGPRLTDEEYDRCLETIASLDPAPKFFVASGSLPPGVPADFLPRVARHVKDIGAKLVADTSGDALRRLPERHVYLLKPNLRELSELVGRDLARQQDQIAAASQLVEQGMAEIVILSLGADGALLVTADGAEHLKAYDVPIRSAVGAGDSMVGGIVLALARGERLRDAVKFGMAAGAAALMTEGSELCRREDVERLLDTH
jgi:6-phosphofructokinase 2